MKKLFITLILLTPISMAQAYTDCSKSKNSFETQKCLYNSVKDLKAKLNKQLEDSLAKTDAKAELNAAQAQWELYKQKQCGDFLAADTSGGPATVEYDLTCQSMLYQQRIAFIKSIFN